MAQHEEPPGALRLTLAEAHTLALRSNPELRAARLDVAIAAAELRQASVLVRSNPSVDLLVGGPGTAVGVMQEVEVAGQRGARRAAASAGIDRASARVLDATRSTVAEVDRTLYRLAAGIQREKLANEVLALNRRLADAASRQLAAGDISQLDQNLATVEYGRSRARAVSVRRQREATESALDRLLGLAPGTAVTPVVDMAPAMGMGAPAGAPVEVPPPDSLSAESLTDLAIARRPDLLERSAAARQARALAILARREALPNLAFRGASEPLETGGRALRAGVGITLPAFNRNRGESAARRAEAEKAELERGALVARTRSEVARAIAVYRAATEEVEVLQTTVLAPARENRRLLEIAYGAGKVGLPVLLLIRNQVIDAELEYWEAWLAVREALTDLREAIAETAIAAAGAP